MAKLIASLFAFVSVVGLAGGAWADCAAHTVTAQSTPVTTSDAGSTPLPVPSTDGTTKTGS